MESFCLMNFYALFSSLVSILAQTFQNTFMFRCVEIAYIQLMRFDVCFLFILNHSSFSNLKSANFVNFLAVKRMLLILTVLSTFTKSFFSVYIELEPHS